MKSADSPKRRPRRPRAAPAPDPAQERRTRAALVRSLRKVPFFHEVSPRHAARLMREAELLRVKKGAVIVRKGEKGSDLYIVLEGTVRVILTGDRKREYALGTMERGSFFGEVSLLDGRTRSATVVAGEDCTLAVLRRERLLDVIREEPAIALTLLAAITRLLRRATEREERFAFLDVNQRLCRLLVRIAEEEGAPVFDSFVRIRRRTHKALSASIGVSRESVTKALKKLESRRVVKRDGDTHLLISPRIFEEC